MIPSRSLEDGEIFFFNYDDVILEKREKNEYIYI